MTARREHGAAVAETVVVTGFVLVLLLGVIQVTLAVHARALAVDAAAEGARVAARADRGPADGVARARELLTASLNSSYARDVTARETTLDGLRVIEVRVTTPLPVIGLLGPAEAVTVRGHALEEP
ncbi:TadE/TadG family type IV pilus assembly protein [Myceligenerans salitolerans]|uniref:Pilus assembly protein n=1 Tax=Myceligenerans salitolerans TaxID=1230528 RepID=A0ABS3I4H7_9MICO|nr:TadE/TadG family type IV pilus assembly protein [Myceligenerans salitolerans]MBO0607905.1 pilus assembly protein [Myceligenerans salitolerans]